MTVTFANELPRGRTGAPLVRPADGGDLVEYVRCSSFGNLLDDHFFLDQWKQRIVAQGCVTDLELLGRMLTTPTDATAVWNNLAKRAFQLGGGTTAADLGTEIHAWTEKVDRGDCTLDEVPDHIRADVTAYREALTAAGLEIVTDWIEVILVNDILRAAGTADRIVRHIATGRLLILDIKTGKDARKIAYGIQLYAYATGVLYDPATETRTTVDIDPTVGIIAHIPAGSGRCKLIAVDLTAIKPVAELCAAIYAARDIDGWHTPFTSSSLTSTGPVPSAAAPGPTATVPAGSSPEPAGTPTRGQQLAAVPDRTPDEGDVLDAAAFNHVRAMQATLNDTQRAWVRDRVTETINAKVSIHTSGGHTERRLAAIETLLASAARIGPERTAHQVEQALRVAIADLVDADWPRFDNVTLGHALGVLNASEADLLARTVMVLDDNGWSSLHAA